DHDAMRKAARFRPFGRLQDTHEFHSSRGLPASLAPIRPMIPQRNCALRRAASADLPVATADKVEHTGLPASECPSSMDRTPSKSMAALWMAGWLALMLMIAVAGREALRELNVFQLILIRSSVGLLLLYPLIHRAGGFAVVKTKRLPQHI